MYTKNIQKRTIGGDELKFRIGLTFRMLTTLTPQLVYGSYWMMVRYPKELPEVDFYKSTALFVKLRDFKLPSKVNDSNSIRLSYNAIKRYYDKKYITFFKSGGGEDDAAAAYELLYPGRAYSASKGRHSSTEIKDSFF